MITLNFKGYTWKGKSFAQFVREHFDDINNARKNGYSWLQIAQVVQNAMAMNDNVQGLDEILRNRFVWEIGLRDKNKRLED